MYWTSATSISKDHLREAFWACLASIQAHLGRWEGPRKRVRTSVFDRKHCSVQLGLPHSHSLPFIMKVVTTGQNGSPHTADVLLGPINDKSVESIQRQILLFRN